MGKVLLLFINNHFVKMFYNIIKCSPDYHRNGITLVEDMINVGFKNLDKRMMKRKKSGVPTLEVIKTNK